MKEVRARPTVKHPVSVGLVWMMVAAAAPAAYGQKIDRIQPSDFCPTIFGGLIGVSTDGATWAGTCEGNGLFFHREETGTVSFQSPVGRIDDLRLSGDGRAVVGTIFETQQAIVLFDDQSYQTVDALFPEYPEMKVTAVDNDGSHVAGYSYNEFVCSPPICVPENPRSPVQQGFISANGTRILLGIPEGLKTPKTLIRDMTADGSMVVGQIEDGLYLEAFSWKDSVYTMLGTPDGYVGSFANAVSDDGSVIVGGLYTGVGANFGTRAALWTSEEGWQILDGDDATAISADGSIISGSYGYPSPNGWLEKREDPTRRILLGQLIDEYFGLSGVILIPSDLANVGNRIFLPQGDFLHILHEKYLELSGPSEDELWLAGTHQDIEWESSGIENVHILLSTGRSRTEVSLIALDVPADSGRYAWTVPDSLSKFASIIIEDGNDETLADTSAYFRIKGYHLTRLDEDGEYEGFNPTKHGWGFGNTGTNLAPEHHSDIEVFQYTRTPIPGVDPFRGAPYDRDDFVPLGVTALRFPDYPSFARAFGEDEFYWLDPVLGFYKNSGLTFWNTKSRPAWAGSCSGMSISSIMAFFDPQRFGATYPEIGATAQLIGVPLEEPVRHTINKLYTYWEGEAALIHGNLRAFDSPRMTLETLKQVLLDAEEESSSASYVYINNLPPSPLKSSAHAVVPYKLTRISTQPNLWDLSIYDPNFPAETRTIRIDSTSNSWSYSPTYDGSGRFLLMNSYLFYFGQAVRPVATANKVDMEPALTVFPTSFAHITIQSALGQVGYADSVAFSSLVEAELNLVPSGYPSSPQSYELPSDTYRVRMSNYPDPMAAFAFTEGSVSYTTLRSDAEPGDVDRFSLPDGLTVANPDNRSKDYRIRVLSDGSDQERLFELAGVALASGDSIRIRLESDSLLLIENFGGSVSYDLNIERGGEDTVMTFRHPGVSLSAGSRQLVQPNWMQLGDDATILIDADGDGSFEGSERIGNVPVAIEDEARSASHVPSEFRLLQNYPNPFNPTTRIAFDLPTPSDVTIRVYDISGRLVDEVVSGARPAGRHAVQWDASTRSAGLYYYRMQAGDFVATRLMVLAK